jgi:hypothetical protein
MVGPAQPALEWFYNLKTERKDTEKEILKQMGGSQWGSLSFPFSRVKQRNGMITCQTQLQGRASIILLG